MYDRYELHKMVLFSDNHGGTFDEQINTEEDQECADEEGMRQFWSVFGHIPDKGLDCISDFYNEESATLLYEFLSKTLEGYNILQKVYKHYKEFAKNGDGDLFDDRLGDSMDKAAKII